MAIAGTRESIIKQFFSSFKELFIGENRNNEVPTIGSLSKKDLKGVSKADLEELFKKSPKRIVEIAKANSIGTPVKRKTSFAAGSSVSQGLPEINKAEQGNKDMERDERDERD